MDPVPPPISLPNLPILVLKIIISNLDVGHALSLTQVNRQLRYFLVTDHCFCHFLLYQRFSIRLTGRTTRESPFDYIPLPLHGKPPTASLSPPILACAPL
jgi:hypothetical protein